MNLIFTDIAVESIKTGQKNVGQKKGDKETRRQGDKETRREKSSCLPFSLSPRLPVSPSSCPLCPYFPTPAAASELPQLKVEKANENARTLPPSRSATSSTVNIHVPFPFSPLNAASGLTGLNNPV
jgi:hypothetical protein